ncbi:MAG: hypothetical protein ACWA5W_00350 [Phycisphaerales bacterium]
MDARADDYQNISNRGVVLAVLSGGTICEMTKGSTTMDLLEQLQQLTESCREDYNKAKGGNKAAGTRVRKVMQEVKGLAQEIRKEMLGSRDD